MIRFTLGVSIVFFIFITKLQALNYDTLLAKYSGDSVSLFIQEKIDENNFSEIELALEYQNVAYLLNKKKQYENSLAFYMKAVDLFHKLLNYEKEIDCLNKIGYMCFITDQKELGTQKSIETLKIVEQQKLSDSLSIKALSNLGFINRINNIPLALKYFEKAKELSNKYNDLDYLSTAYNEIANINLREGKLEEALKNFEKSIKIKESITSNSVNLAFSYNDLASAFSQNLEFSKSLYYFLKSYDILEKTDLLREKIIILTNISNNYLNLKDKENSLKYLKLAEEGALKTNIAQLKLNIWGNYVSYYNSIEDYKNAFFYLSFLKNITDSIYAAENYEKIAEMQEKYESEQKEKEIKILTQNQEIQDIKLKQNNIILIGTIVLLALIIALAIAIYKRYKIKIKSNEILVYQKNEIEAQRDEIEAQRNEVTKQRDLILNQNQEIISGITYAKRIQTASMPNNKVLNNILNNYFLIYKPLNIVSGDFYWTTKIDNKKIIAVADCTGHGVPGAFMSLLGISFLNEIINDKHIVNPSEILNLLRDKVIQTLHQQNKEITNEKFNNFASDVRDGMDMAICVLTDESDSIEFAGANSSIIILSDNTESKEIAEYKGDRMPVGVHGKMQNYNLNTIKITGKSKLFLFTDGFIDQFGGDKGKKLQKTEFKNIIIKTSNNSIKLQGIEIDDIFEKWKNNYIQTDDVLVLGIEIN